MTRSYVRETDASHMLILYCYHARAYCTMEKGMATGSVVTLWPAMNITFSAIADNPCNSSKIEMT